MTTRLTMTQPIDARITRVVAALQANGFRTTDSGDGVSKGESIADGCAEAYPHVYMVVQPEEMVAEARRLFSLARGLFIDAAVRDMAADPFDDDGNVIPRRAIEATYSPVDGVAMLCLIGFSDADLRVN